jgi:twinkle protein
VDRFHGQGQEANWQPTGFDEDVRQVRLRPGELTVWAGINKHGKTTFLTNVMLNVMQAGQKVCIASMEMKPAETMAKMTRQAAGTGSPPSSSSASSTSGPTAGCGSTTTSGG